MSWPPKAIRFEDLTESNDGAPVPSSGHLVKKYTFKDADGKSKTGFFKRIDNATYPSLLAKYTVAISVAIRFTLGHLAAEDRLVFKDNTLYGTLSLDIPEYKPLFTKGQLAPSNIEEAEKVCPSHSTLIKKNVAALLVSAWRYKCDDRHPGNFSLYGLIDWDMCLYPYTYIIKGGRYIDKVVNKLPENAMELTTNDLDNFPIINNRTHWPTNDRPSNFHFLKGFYDPKQFQMLAANHLTSSGNNIFQEQMFKAVLKELLTFDAEALSKRLIEYIGTDLKLSYSLLEPEQIKQLQKKHSQFYNKETNDKSFIEHFVSLSKHEYHKLYELVVNYLGCKKNSQGASVPSFYQFLRNKPSACAEILAWLAKNNDQLDQAAQEKLLKRYHQIWRDSHKPLLKYGILHDLTVLTETLSQTLSFSDVKLTSPFVTQPAYFSEKKTDASTKIIAFSSKLSASKNTIHCDESNPVKLGCDAMRDLRIEIGKCAEKYFDKPITDLPEPSENQAFCDEMQALQIKANNIKPYLSSTSWGSKLDAWINKFEQFHLGFNLKRHHGSEDKPMNANPELDYSNLIHLTHTNPDVVRSCMDSLFSWANTYDRTDLVNLINNTLNEKYRTFSYPKSRTSSILTYLGTQEDPSDQQDSQGKKDFHNAENPEKGADLLGTILSIGGTKSTSFNTYLIKRLFREMLRYIPLTLALINLKHAIDSDQFNASHYAAQAQAIVTKKTGFKHRYSYSSILIFQEEFFKAVDNISPEIFQTILTNGSKEYAPKPKHSLFGKMKNVVTNPLKSFRQRGGVIGTLFLDKPLCNSKVIATIFSDGENLSTSLNTTLLKHLLAHIEKAEGKNSPLAFAFNATEEGLIYYGSQLKHYTPKYTQKISSQFLCDTYSSIIYETSPSS